MRSLEIARIRLNNQQLAQRLFKRPDEIVRYMGAMQAQDYAGAKWAVGMRLRNSMDNDVEKAMADGSIIRLHVLRPTWHFVVPADVRWMLQLTAERINKQAKSQHRLYQLDSAIFKKSNDELAKALQGNRQLNRSEMMEVLNRAGIKTDEQRFIHILMQAELDRVICSGARQDKQFTYALFDDRVPLGREWKTDEALAELAKRYFISRGPATVKDFTWWSGLSASDARSAVEMVKAELENITVNNVPYWMAPIVTALDERKLSAYLLPAYDEFAVAYKDRTAVVHHRYLKEARYVIFDPSIVVNNQVAATWKRTVKKNGVEVELNPFGKLNKIQTRTAEAAVERYKEFCRHQ